MDTKITPSLNFKYISVIASFDAHGHVKPLYVRVDEESLKVHSFWLKPSFVDTMDFYCEVIDGNQIKPLLLTYQQRECVWHIPR